MSESAKADTAGRTGRRPGKPDTRAAILAAARRRFADEGFDKTSVRSIATDAGVDSALVHHYFGTKQQLFVEVVALPIDPTTVVATLAEVPLEYLGPHLIRTIVGVWDSPAGAGVIAAFRSVLAGGDAGLIRSFLTDIALENVRKRVDDPAGSGGRRVSLAASQMIGVLVARKILLLEPIASMPIEELAETVGPTLQRYLTGELPDQSSVRPGRPSAR
ncbi:MAG: TetR/AcrR family transcriptional regulator [Aldersonia sp.]|jgi:AcrR family transcriptional regulator|nr:TetR/AcrR family transcriptional regulator [Aldersonia sp.]